MFAAAHHIGPYGEPMRPDWFVFRACAGLYFTLLFVVRGFGIAVGAHVGVRRARRRVRRLTRLRRHRHDPASVRLRAASVPGRRGGWRRFGPRGGWVLPAADSRVGFRRVAGRVAGGTTVFGGRGPPGHPYQ